MRKTVFLELIFFIDKATAYGQKNIQELESTKNANYMLMNIFFYLIQTLKQTLPLFFLKSMLYLRVSDGCC